MTYNVTRETETDKVEGTLLGQRVAAPTTYTPEILVRIPRSENREQYGIEDDLFIGEDHWYAYECSTLTSLGVPVYLGMVFEISSDSKYIVESKSLKLYLNSFNMETGKSVHPSDIEHDFMATVKSDLSALLETDVYVSSLDSFYKISDLVNDFDDLRSIVDFSMIEILHFNEAPQVLRTSTRRRDKRMKVCFSGFRSNCKVTHQPDYATVFIEIETPLGVDPASLVEYLSSFRNESHFHEECVEAIFKRLTDAYHPTSLFVRANYTRRGGIDINPTRSSIRQYRSGGLTFSPNLKPADIKASRRAYSHPASRTKYQ